MRHRSEEIDLAWESLRKSDDLTPGWRSIAVTSSAHVTIHAGQRFPSRDEAILVRFTSSLAPGKAQLPEGTGFIVERAEPFPDGSCWLALTRRAPGRRDLFLAMVCDVAEAVDEAASRNEELAMKTFLGRIRAWQEFMRKGAAILEPEAEVGLIGELAALLALIEAGVPAASACEGWTGPLDGLRDFELGTGSVEVKSTTSGTGFPAKVGSLEQLADNVRQPLFLCGVRLRQAATGRTLAEHVEAMRDIVRGEPEAERLLAERLVAAGYLDAHSDAYVRKLELGNIRFLKVADKFPRLTPDTVPAGVTHARYVIDLDKIGGETLSIDKIIQELGVN